MRMNSPKVSVVIPCYNVEKYLHQCLDSVINQTLTDLEIICVNDGSRDSTLSIIKEYEAKDSRIKVIDKPNGGYGESMNRGFDMATGEYIGIIESDDYADLDMFEKLYTCAKEHNLDAVKSGFYFYYSKGEERNVPNPIASRVASSRTFCPTADFKSDMELVEFFNIKPTIWSAIYRKDFVRQHNIRFNETPGASFQDTSFNFKVWSCAKRVRLMKECFLHYRQDNESSSINNPGKVYCVCDEYAEIQRFLDENPLLKGKLEPLMVRIKFDSYCWNYERLSEPLQAEFIRRLYDEFMSHKIDGTLQKKYFEWYKWARVHQILDNPDAYHRNFILEKNKPFITDAAAPSEFTKKNSGDPYTYNGLNGMPRNKISGGIQCIKDHGLGYTIKYAFKKIWWRVK
ncbi:MAG: glycosyltransferase [Ruminococcaceae bacterium]|nr:glycosyltransferase [Oscillospiraceae bacterium]